MSNQRERELEVKIRNLLKEKAPLEELQKAYDELYSHILKHGFSGIPPFSGTPPKNYLYSGILSPVYRLFLDIIDVGSSVLEVGIGDGHFLIACARKGILVSGLDISKVLIRRLKGMLKREGITAKLKLGDARHLEFPNEAFDYVVSKDLIEHIPKEDLQVHFREVWRVLRSNGRYLIWTPSKLLGSSSLGSHMNEYSLTEVLQETTKAGFEPAVLSLHAYVLFRSARIIPYGMIPYLKIYERIVERSIRLIIHRYHNLLYLVVPPVCVVAYKHT